MFDSEETKGFIYGFAATVAAGLVTLYVFQKYIAERAASTALENYTQKYGIMSTRPIAQKKVSTTEPTSINTLSKPTDGAKLNAFGMQ